MNLGDKLIKLRKDNKISQEEFAEELGVSRQTVSNWENYKSYPDVSTIIKISDLFNVSLDILLKGDIKMISDMDTKIKDSKKYKKALTVIGGVLLVIVLVFGIYAIRYSSVKKELENKFNVALKKNDFKLNKEGYYSSESVGNIVYSVPNQKMPGLLDFSLHFHNTSLYCDGALEDGRDLEATWNDYDSYDFAISKDGIIVGSSAGLKKKDDVAKLSEELGIDEVELRKIIDKGNQLYKEFYG